MKCVTILVITGHSGLVTRDLKKNLEAKVGNIQFTTKGIYAWNITHKMGSTAI
jgi:hypothetical protein